MFLLAGANARAWKYVGGQDQAHPCTISEGTAFAVENGWSLKTTDMLTGRVIVMTFNA